MDFSEGWKSMWSISSVFGAPLLYSGHNARSLGPLNFHPNSSTNILLSSPSLCPQIPLPLDPFSFHQSVHAFYHSSKLNFIPSSILSSIALDAIAVDAISQPPHHHCSDNPILHNTLQILRRSTGDLILFFLIGNNAEQIGYVILSSNHKILINKDGNIFKEHLSLHHRILKFSVIGAIANGCSSSLPFSSSNSLMEGLLLACTLYSVHWFSVETRVSSCGVSDMPVLVHLASAQFGNCVVHACWSPHLQGESAILLDNGELRVADLDSCFDAMKLPMKLRGTRAMVLPNELSGDGGHLVWEKGSWLSCEFGWHPRILIACSSAAVLLIDLRFEEKNVTVLAKIEMCDSFRVHSLLTDRFIAFCKASFNDFFFSVATEHHLLLFDVRQPLTPILQWDHGLDHPHCIHMLRLSALRPSTKEGDFKWASEAGFAILLGSFWNCQFSVFCYGPSLQVADRSMASKVSKLCNSLYAWELPSGLSLSGHESRCGNCLVREDFSKAILPVGIDWHWVKEMVLGFCILSEDLSTQNFEHNLENAPKPNGLGGFTLIRLTSSGKLETQRYQASWDSVVAKCDEPSSHLEDTLLCSQSEEGKVYAPYGIQKFDYLFGHLSDNLLKIFASKMQLISQDCAKNRCDTTNTVYCTQDSRELICNTLKAAGIDLIGSPPTISNILNGIRFPTSIYEIASRRIWGSLSLDLLRLAFFTYVDIFEGQGNMHLEFLDIPAFPNMQLPPFFLRKPSRRGERGLGRVPRGVGLVGPVLPIQVLLSLKQLDGKESNYGSRKEVNGFLGEVLAYQCNEVNKVVDNLSHNEADAVSLSDDNDKWVTSQDMQDKNNFLLYEPQVFFNNSSLYRKISTDGGCLLKDETNQIQGKEFTTIISRKQKVATLDAGVEQVGLEMFDDLSPIQLKFDSPAMNFELEELKTYKCLKREFSKWQESFKPFEDFCTSSLLPKRS